jgi:hypothetical protein
MLLFLALSSAVAKTTVIRLAAAAAVVDLVDGMIPAVILVIFAISVIFLTVIGVRFLHSNPYICSQAPEVFFKSKDNLRTQGSKSSKKMTGNGI